MKLEHVELGAFIVERSFQAQMSFASKLARVEEIISALRNILLCDF